VFYIYIYIFFMFLAFLLILVDAVWVEVKMAVVNWIDGVAGLEKTS
jgi:hypothetical protein